MYQRNAMALLTVKHAWYNFLFEIVKPLRVKDTTSTAFSVKIYIAKHCVAANAVN